MALIDLRVPAPHAVDAGRVVTFGGGRIVTPDVVTLTGTRNDLDVGVKDATSGFLRAATQTNLETNREGGTR